jgi:hypothetical protein
VNDNHSKSILHLLQDLKRHGIHNKSKTDPKNKVAIKNAQKNARKTNNVKGGPFNNLHELQLTLDLHKQSVESLHSEAVTAFQNQLVAALMDETDPLWNIIVLDHDLIEGTTGLQDWTKIIVTFPSTISALKAMPELWGTGQVQLKIDYSKGYWKNNLRQLGQVGVSDANRKYHPIAFGVQALEDGPGSKDILSLACQLVSAFSAVPISCLQDAAEALHFGVNACSAACRERLLRPHDSTYRPSRGEVDFADHVGPSHDSFSTTRTKKQRDTCIHCVTCVTFFHITLLSLT